MIFFSLLGFQAGWVQWDDQNEMWDKENNANTQAGAVPDSVIKPDTKIHFCCREDASPLRPIFLPTSSPFYLFPKGRECQRVYNTRATLEVIQFARGWWGIKDVDLADRGGHHPTIRIRSNALIVFYCYYQPIGATRMFEITL